MAPLPRFMAPADHALLPRYARQQSLRDFGPAGQGALASARVLIVGVGGLGSPASMYLAAAGVGGLTLVDTDRVEESNLHRQLLFGMPDVGAPKVEAARERLAAINPHVEVLVHEERLSAANAARFVAGHDVVIDATDNFPTRYALNDACLAAGVPFVYGSVARFEGQVSVFAAPGGPCYRCLFPEPPAPGHVPTCAEEGVLGVVPGIIGLYQATETIKLITGIGTPLVGRLLMVDLLDHGTSTIALARRADCPSCSAAAASGTGSAGGSATGSAHNARQTQMTVQITPAQLSERLQSPAPPVVLDVREPWEFETAHVAGSQLVPLSSLQGAVSALDPALEYVVLCHHGMRSEMAATWLATQGFTRVANLTGGIDRWSLEVDPTVPRY